MHEDPGILKTLAPKALAECLVSALPFEVRVHGKRLEFSPSGRGRSTAVCGDLEASFRYEFRREFSSLTYDIAFHNKSDSVIAGIEVRPLTLRFDADPKTHLPRVRHLSGSNHFDACYPPRAFRLSEEAFMTPDFSRKVVIEGQDAKDNVPILQFAVDTGDRLSGFFVGFEWFAGWKLEAGWEQMTTFGEKRPHFVVDGTMNLGDLSVGPGDSVEIPRVHMGFFEGDGWTELDNLQRRFIRDHLAARLDGGLVQPVAYDHWFGIYTDFDLAYMMLQADRAAEIGCEYFCLDAGWYKTGGDHRPGEGNWETPDPGRFPRGFEDLKTLSKHVRSLGMGFGLWYLIQIAMPGSDALENHSEAFGEPAKIFELPGEKHLRLDTAQGVEYALDTQRRLIKELNLTWVRYENAALDGLDYNRGYNLVIDTLRREFPDLYIENCSGGSKTLNLASVSRTHGNWLSDHTSHPDVCRFMQTSALRFWPANYLSMAVVAFRGRGGECATSHEILSRMVGVPLFSGAISEWSTEETEMARKHVAVYKRIRRYREQPVFFPLPQPRSLGDWDVVVFGDGSGEKQLLYAYRMTGPENVSVEIPPAEGSWTQLLGADKAGITGAGSAFTLSLAKNSSAIWIR